MESGTPVLQESEATKVVIPSEESLERRVKFKIPNPPQGIRNLYVDYTLRSESEGGKLLSEREDLNVGYDYGGSTPEGRKSQEFIGFRVDNRDYNNLYQGFSQQPEIDSRVLEFLHGALSMEFSRLLPKIS